tara:strand:- start:239 stop:466 length:228 start_codon:yes stop_codon:yes gene_type:complete
MSDFDKWWIAERDLTPHDRYIMWRRQQADIERLNALKAEIERLRTGLQKIAAQRNQLGWSVAAHWADRILEAGDE